MTASANDLQRAVFAALSQDAAIEAALGGPKIFDHAPANVVFPYITFGRTSIYDWSTGTESGTEQLFTLHVWSKAKGRQEAQAIMELSRLRLHDRTLVLDGYALVNCRMDFAEVRYDDDLAVHHGLQRFRAVVEDE